MVTGHSKWLELLETTRIGKASLEVDSKESIPQSGFDVSGTEPSGYASKPFYNTQR